MKDIGAKWFKCDLHLHTTASLCFKNQKVTAQEWVQECLNKELDCVAVTDHNSGAGIEEIQIEAEKHGLHVFPGVEITCDSSKVHLLILFDLGTKYKAIEDFLIKCDIDREKFGKQDAFTEKSIFEIAEIAKSKNALVIPAHIDEYNGLGNIGPLPLGNFLDLQNINAVQVVHKPFFENNKDNISDYLSNYYPLVKGKSRKIDETTIKNWHRPVRVALEKGMGILTFSDNPHEKRNSQHGLWGIGTRYTWIKMDIKPSLEGLRQAFLMPKLRIKNDFICETNPNKRPEISINSLTLKNTLLNNEEEFTINFHQQLNTIIGGPGSGKSSILKCIRGILKNTNEIKQLNSILDDHNEFYKKVDKSKRGIFNDRSILKLSINKGNINYEVEAKSIKNTDKQEIKVYKIDGDNQEEQPFETLSFLRTEHYSQKQIFEIAQQPNSLREQIDNAIESMKDKKEDLAKLKSTFLSQSADVRKLYSETYNKKTLKAEINDIENQISAFDKSKIGDLSKDKDKYEEQFSFTKGFKEQVKREISNLSSFINDFKVDHSINLDKFDKTDAEELKIGIDQVNATFGAVKEKMTVLKDQLEQGYIDYQKYIKESKWYKGFEDNSAALESQKTKLQEQGLESFNKYDELITQRTTKKDELRNLEEIEKKLENLKLEKNETQELYLEKASEISKIRKQFLDKILKGKNIRVKINKFRDKLSFEKQVRSIINKEKGFESDIDELIKKCFDRGKPEDNLVEFRKRVRRVRKGEKIENITKNLNNLFEILDDVQIDKMQILVPEDEIIIEYKPKNDKAFKPLSNASAGQKTTAILTFLLSFGNKPLILDQPEDDLNGKLVYDLIVDKLQDAKSNRQIIIVTHNANIPVNADAELITCLSSNTEKLTIALQGTVDIPEIKREICDVMEGSVDAFDMRAKRYSALKSK